MKLAAASKMATPPHRTHFRLRRGACDRSSQAAAEEHHGGLIGPLPFFGMTSTVEPDAVESVWPYDSFRSLLWPFWDPQVEHARVECVDL